MTALSVIQGSGRVVRNEKDYAETFIFDDSFRMLLPRFPDWWREAVQVRTSGPPKKLPARSIVSDDWQKHGSQKKTSIFANRRLS